MACCAERFRWQYEKVELGFVTMKQGFFYTFLISLLAITISNADNWPRYLGKDGKSETTDEISATWKKAQPTIIWDAEVGKGCAGFVIADGIAVTLGNDQDRDTVFAFDAKTGKVLWKDTYDEPLQPKYYTGGPGATPTIYDNSVFVLSKSGRLCRYGLKDGKKAWTKNLEKDFGGEMPDWGFSAAPVFEGGDLILPVYGKKGSLVALDPETGELRWKSRDQQKPGYATPLIIQHEGKTAALVFHGRTLVAHDLAKEGEVLFTIPWRTSYEVNASNPHYDNGKVFLASGYGMGYGVFDVTADEPKKLHANPDTRLIFQNSILSDDSLLAVFGDKNIPAKLMKMDLATGKIAWETKIPGTRGSLAKAGETLIVLSETGELLVGQATDSRFEIGGKMQILPRLCWAPLAIADGKLYARSNGGKAVCVDLP